MFKDILTKGFQFGGLFFFATLFIGISYLPANATSQNEIKKDTTPLSTLIDTLSMDTSMMSIKDDIKSDTIPLSVLNDTLSMDTSMMSIKEEVIKDTMPLSILSDSLTVDTTSKIVEEVKLYKIIGVGDMMLGTNYPAASYLPANGGRDLLTDVEGILQNADVTFGNLEGTILNEGGTVKRCSDPSLCYAFRSPESYINHFIYAGFDVVSLANNHSGDFGSTGRIRTKEILQSAGIEFAGLAGTDETAIFTKNGVTYGFCAFAPNRGTCDIRNIPRAKTIVSQLAAQTDIVIVSFHGGAEGEKNQHVTKKTETYYGENRGNVHQFAHAVVDAGADIVFGHGPHVTRAAEIYNDRFIIYSLGNFCTYGRFNLRGAAGIAPIISLTVDENGAFVSGQVTPIYQQKTHGPKVDPQNRATKKLIELTKSDFPNGILKIYEDGWMIKQ